MKSLIIIGILVCLLRLDTVIGCSCLFPHPQTNYCESDYVILAEPYSTILTDNIETEISVDIKKIYKQKNGTDESLKTQKLYSSVSSAACGVELSDNTTYVIMGGSWENRNYVSLCNYIGNWESIPSFQKDGIESIYEKGCDCQIDEFSKEKTDTKCIIENRDDFYCYTKYSACVKTNNECNWIGNSDLTKCIESNRKAA